MTNESASDSATSQRDYVLGTHDAERDRLERQHELWLVEARRTWAAAGVKPGARVLDLGCGPGLATASLAAEVGPSGRVAGVELSPAFAQQARDRCAAAGRPDVVIEELDLMKASLPAPFRGVFDVVWVRWLAMFVPQPERIITVAREALVDGGVIAMHEYFDYGTYSLHPNGPRMNEFVQHAIHSFEREGGDAHIARRLPSLLVAHDFEILSLRPIARVARPHEPLWHWPAGFARTFAPKLCASGVVDRAWVDALFDELARAEHDPGSLFIAPSVLEIIARVAPLSTERGAR